MNKLKKTKTANHSKVAEKSAKIVDFYPDLFFFKQIPVHEAFIDRLAQEMVEFAELETTIRPSQFWLSKRLDVIYITRWRAKWPQMQRAYDYLYACCAMRRDVGAATRKLDGSYIEKTQIMYDPEWKDLMEWRSKLNAKDEIFGGGGFIAQMIVAPNSSEVPERKKND